MSQHAAAAPSAKQTAGLDLLRSLKIDFDSTHETLAKLLANIVGNPAEPKYRKLRTTNEKIKLLLSALGAKQLLVGSGFAEDGEFLVLPEAANISLVQLALDGLRANQSAKVAEEAAKKKEEAAAARARAMTKRRADEVPLAKVAQAKAQHILLQVSETQSFEQIDKKLAGWKAILEDAPYHNQEHDFGELAKAHSECPSGARGGNLGFFAKGKMVDEFDAICFEQKTRAIYGPVRTATGSHLIFLHARIEK
jgi:parvulin-like peptidyl-prolyl isomerase